MGKKIKKAVKSVTKSVSKVAGVASGGLLGRGGLLSGGDDKPKVVQQPAAAAAEAPAPTPVAASVVEAPKGDVTDGSDDSDTEAAKKAARAKGKRGLQVARSAGSGLNI